MSILRQLLPFLLACRAFSKPAPIFARQDVVVSGELPSLSVTTSFEPTLVPTQTAAATNAPYSLGFFDLDLPYGAGTELPFPTNVIEMDVALPDVTDILEPILPEVDAFNAVDVFKPIALGTTPSQIRSRGDHPAPVSGLQITSSPLDTNKFYANFYLSKRNQSTWTLPYSLSWIKGGSELRSWGIGISHVRAEQLVFGPNETNPADYFVAPLGIYSVVLSALELGNSTALTVDSGTAFSAIINLRTSPGSRPLIGFPVVQGMGFVTGIYAGATPLLESIPLFAKLSYVGALTASRMVYKWRIDLHDGTTWLLYVTPSGSVGQPPFRLQSNQRIVGPSQFSGIIQIAKTPDGANGEAVYDQTAGVYPISAKLYGNVSGRNGAYTIDWTRGGLTDRTLLMFAHPHHVASFDSTTRGKMTSLQLQTPTKGIAIGVVSNSFAMREHDLPIDSGFMPWSESQNVVLSRSALRSIRRAAREELRQNITAQAVLNSMYFSGKALAKFAQITLVANDIVEDHRLAAAGLKKLQAVYDVFVQNKQPFPLVYDSKFKGLVSEGAWITGNPLEDFGNTYYNDHHFHYGYFVYTAAVIGYLDPKWLTRGTNKVWVNALLRDFANPVATDGDFPHIRAFDWFSGHSWAKGLFESADGKDQESTSEDVFASYAQKMWGRVIGDSSLEGRANLQLAIQRRTFNSYFLLASNNTIQPPRYIDNKVSGILWENRANHTTYFGNNIEYIQGIQMIPLNPLSAYSRPAYFVREEWDRYFSEGRVDTIEGGWRGILYANLALIDPVASYEWFSQRDFNMTYLDGGASLTWYLAFSAGLGGSLA